MHPPVPIRAVVVFSRPDPTVFQTVNTDTKAGVAVPPLPTNGGVPATAAGETLPVLAHFS